MVACQGHILESTQGFEMKLCLRNKTSVTVFYRGNKTWVRVWVLMN